MKVHHVPCGPAVNESERKAIEQLKNRLATELGDDEWFLLSNLPFSATHELQSDEIDIVAVGPPGLQIIEVKHWTAAWVDKNRGIVEREADRLTAKARRVGTTLRKKVSGLGRVDGVFMVTEAASKVAALEGRKVRGVKFYSLKDWRGAVGLGSRRILSVQEIRDLGRILNPGSTLAADGALERIAGYAHLNLQTPEDERFHRVYKAVHHSRQDRVVLHLYDLSADEDARAEKRAEREWRSLQKLQQHSWAPRIVDSFQEAPGYPGEIKFFTIVDFEAPAIAERASDSSWDSNARLDFARQAVRALADLHGTSAGSHGEPMVHRNLTPLTILVKHDNLPILTGFEHTRIPTEVSVAPPVIRDESDSYCIAPEVLIQGRGAADHRSDIYSLCASLETLFLNREDRTSQEAMKLLGLGKDKLPKSRPSLLDIDEKLSKLVGEPMSSRSLPPPRFWTEGQVVSFRDRDYRIISYLGSGGVGSTYKVVEIDPKTREDLGTYVAKVVSKKETGQRILRAYELARPHLRHSALSTIFEVAHRREENDFIALMSWIEGRPLNDYAGVFPLSVENRGDELGEMLALGWLREACKALQVLHTNGLVHGDVSPRNMITSREKLVLTDYDYVTEIGKQARGPGTVNYCSPSRLQGGACAPSDDFYALASSFYRVVFDREPFPHGGAVEEERRLNWDAIDREEYPVLVPFLDRATEPRASQRFESAEDALKALGHDQPPEEATDGAPSTVRTVQRTKNEVVPWLKSLLQSYPGSRWGNSETRGLDTDFAKKTYVKTNLEKVLLRDIKNRRVNLVILCGNAGDGKTALLQHLARGLGLKVDNSAERVLEGRLDNGLMVRMNLDGSASWDGCSANDLLDEFLKPFQDGNPGENIVHFLAINDGRLLEWIEHVEERPRGETLLTRSLSSFLENHTSASDPHIRFINLNQRSLVGGIASDRKTIDTSFLDQLVDALYGGEQAAATWAPCQTCLAQERCEIYRASRKFGPGELAENGPVRDRARQRLFEALQAVHLRGEVHITVRELRAALVYILFGTRYCSEYHAMGEDSASSSFEPYWDRAFSPVSFGRQGEVLRELPRFDPALEAQPQIDRRLLQLKPGNYTDIDSLPDETRKLEPLRRSAYFKWSEQEIEKLTGDPNALGLARGRHLKRFRDLATDESGDERKQLIRQLCGGISRLESLPRRALEQSTDIPLRITPRTPTETAFWIEKPIDSFRLEPDIPDGKNGLDRLHRQALLVYSYRDGKEEKLHLGANLFHVLLDLNEGYQLGDVATDDIFSHLSIFVQRLVREDHRQLFAWNPMLEDKIFEVAVRIQATDSGPRQLMKIAPQETPKNTHAE